MVSLWPKYAVTRFDLQPGFKSLQPDERLAPPPAGTAGKVATQLRTTSGIEPRIACIATDWEDCSHSPRWCAQTARPVKSGQWFAADHAAQTCLGRVVAMSQLNIQFDHLHANAAPAPVRWVRCSNRQRSIHQSGKLARSQLSVFGPARCITLLNLGHAGQKSQLGNLMITEVAAFIVELLSFSMVCTPAIIFTLPGSRIFSACMSHLWVHQEQSLAAPLRWCLGKLTTLLLLG
jgi:hypothetical protein